MNVNTKTFILLSPGFAANESDTTCLPMQQHFILELKNRFKEINFIVLAFQYPYVIKQYHWFGIEIHCFNGRNRGGIARWKTRHAILRTLSHIHTTTEITGILSFWLGECAYIGNLFAKKHKLLHKTWLLGQDVKPVNKFFKRIRPTPHELIALSDFLQNETENNHGVRPKNVIPAGVTKVHSSSLTISRDIELLAAGSLIPLKRFELFVELVSELKQIYPGLKCLLIGAGPEEKKLRKLIHAHNLESQIKLTGEVSHPEVIMIMRRARIFVHPSAFEGFSGVCLEALASGCRVISFCKPMNNDIAGWDIVESMKELRNKCVKYLVDHTTSPDVPKEYLMENVVEKMADVFRLAANRQPSTIKHEIDHY